MPPGTFAVALATADSEELEQVRIRLEELEIPHSAVVEGEGEYRGQLMAIGIEPTQDRSQIRKAVSSLPLVK